MLFYIFTEIKHWDAIYFCQFGENKMESSLTICWAKYVELIAFDYNQHVILIRTQMLDSSQLGQHQILGPNLPKIIWMTKLLKKINVQIIKNRH